LITGTAPARADRPERRSGVEVAAAVLEVLERQQQLRCGQAVRPSSSLHSPAERDLARPAAAAWASASAPRPPLARPELAAPSAIAPRADHDHLLAALAGRGDLARERGQPLAPRLPSPPHSSAEPTLSTTRGV
jgi:hypothetical protein